MIAETINRPFRPRGVINASALEAVMLTLLSDPEITRSELAERYPILLADTRFLRVITGATTDTLIREERLRIAREVLSNGPK
jgi:hypothetical protein